MNKAKNWFWGVFFILAGVVVVASQVRGFATLSLWSVLSLVLLAAIFIQSLVRRNFVGVLLPVAVVYIILQGPFSLLYIRPWMLILAAVLGGVGLGMIFRQKPHRANYGHWNGNGYPSHGGAHPDMDLECSDDGDNNPYAKVKFGATSRYVHANALESGQFSASFGSLEVYLDEAKLSEAGAELFVDCNFGAVKLYVPKAWRIEERMSTTVGGVSNDVRFARPDESLPPVVLSGNVQFGGVEVWYL